MKNSNTKSNHGITLIEVLVVVAIIGILSAIAAPSFSSMIQKGRTTKEINSFVSDLTLARAEAIKQGQIVTICASLNGATCSGLNNWQGGWLIFNNPTGSGTPTSATVVKKQKTFQSSNTFVADNAVNSINFTSEGFTSGLPSVSYVTFVLMSSPVNASATQCITINKVGRRQLLTSGIGGCP